MVTWKNLDFKQKTIFFCGLIIIIFSFIPIWIHPVYSAFWIPLIGMWIGPPLNRFVPVSLWFYILAVITLFGGILCCYEQKNHKIALYGSLVALSSAFLFMAIFIAGTCDLNRPYFVIDSLIGDTYAKYVSTIDSSLKAQYLLQLTNLIYTKILIEMTMYFQMFNGYIISLNHATTYYLGSIPILFGALATVVAW